MNQYSNQLNKNLIQTEKTFKKTKASYDKSVSKAVGEYFCVHPEEKELMLNRIARESQLKECEGRKGLISKGENQ